MINNRIVFFFFGIKIDSEYSREKNDWFVFFRFTDVFRLAPMAYSDKSGNGLKNLYSMMSYCLNESQCRRKLIAKYFDEMWQSNDCNQMCDICKRGTTSTAKRNCRDEALTIIDYLNNNKKERLTALKLMEKLKIKTMTKLDLQRLILQLIIDQYLKEDFHFTAYATICYIKPGPRSECVKNENCQILLDIVENIQTPTSNFIKKTAKKPSLTTSLTGKRSHKISISLLFCLDHRPRLQSVTNTESVVKPIRRKRRILEYDDDEDDDNDKVNTLITKKPNTMVTDGQS